MAEDRSENIPVTVTFLEKQTASMYSSLLLPNQQTTMLRTRDIQLHFYRYLADRVGRK